jgi:hypothetical protein
MRALFFDRKVWIFVALVAVGLIASAIVAPMVPPAIDWHTVFRPATLEVLSGRSPYKIAGYYYPPWAILPLIPFALFPEEIGRIFLLIFALGVFAYIANKLGASRTAVIALLVSPLVLHEVLNGNIDWLAVLGVVFPPWLGLFFVVIKPQVGIGVIIFWLFFAWKEGGVKKVIKTFAPVTIAYGLSLIVFGLWPLAASKALNLWWNANFWPVPVPVGGEVMWQLQTMVNSSFWPVSIPVGLALLVTAIRKNDIRYAMGASPCLSPYVLFHSWVIVLLAIVASTPETVAAVIGLWILVVIRSLGG